MKKYLIEQLAVIESDIENHPEYYTDNGKLKSIANNIRKLIQEINCK